MVGQHIRILKGGRWVHAVDCGDETVLHLVEEAPPPRVRRAYRPEFVAGADAVEVVTHRERTFPAKEIVKRAYSRASDPALAVMFRDSEAFVEWCTTGRLATARNVALEVPGVAPAAPAPPKGPAPRSNGTPAAPAAKPTARAARKVKAKASAPARSRSPAKRRPAPAKKLAPKPKARAAPPAQKAKTKTKMKAKPAPRARAKKASAKKPARKGRG
jgi:hypothetical protein